MSVFKICIKLELIYRKKCTAVGDTVAPPDIYQMVRPSETPSEKKRTNKAENNTSRFVHLLNLPQTCRRFTRGPTTHENRREGVNNERTISLLTY